MIKKILPSITLALAAGIASITGGAHTAVAADVLFQSIPDLTVMPEANAWCSACFGSYRVYDTFTLSAPATVSQIDFAVQTDWYFPTTVDVGIYALNNGVPGTQLYDQSFAPADFLATSNTQYDTTIVSVAPTDLTLAAGSYDISFYNTSELGVPGYNNPDGTLYQSGAGFHDGESAAFDLQGAAQAVPEPASIALVGLGLTGLGLVRRKRA